MMVRISRTGIQLLSCASEEVNASFGVNGDVSLKRNRWDDNSDLSPCESPTNSPPARIASVPTLNGLTTGSDVSVPLKKRMKRSESSVFNAHEPRSLGLKKTQTGGNVTTKPEEYLERIMQMSGVSVESINVDPQSFLPIEEQHHSSYPQAALAARNEDLPCLEKLHHEGHNLQCSNKFGESIVHIVCRRSRDDILAFLISEVRISLRVRDDLGRTPLHDAAWTERPNFKLVKRILCHEPDLIFVRDNRGNSPLAYVPKQNWDMWNRFLGENQEYFLTPLK